jgi:hypothetical protein
VAVLPPRFARRFIASNVLHNRDLSNSPTLSADAAMSGPARMRHFPFA